MKLQRAHASIWSGGMGSQPLASGRDAVGLAREGCGPLPISLRVQVALGDQRVDSHRAGGQTLPLICHFRLGTAVSDTVVCNTWTLYYLSMLFHSLSGVESSFSSP